MKAGELITNYVADPADRETLVHHDFISHWTMTC